MHDLYRPLGQEHARADIKNTVAGVDQIHNRLKRGRHALARRRACKRRDHADTFAHPRRRFRRNKEPCELEGQLRIPRIARHEEILHALAVEKARVAFTAFDRRHGEGAHLEVRRRRVFHFVFEPNTAENHRGVPLDKMELAFRVRHRHRAPLHET